MARGILRLSLCLMAFFIALGDVGALIGEGVGIAAVYLSISLFVGLHMFMNVRDTGVVLSTDAFILFLLVTILAVAQASYGVSTYEVSDFNLKLIVCVVFFLILAQHLRRYPENIDYALAAFSIGGIILAIAALTIPGVGESYKGQFIILGENPNSTSTRMAVAFVFLLSTVVGRGLSTIRLLALISALVLLMAVIVMSGSRGSLLAVVLSSLLLVTLAPVQKLYKIILLLILAVAILVLGQQLLMTDGIGERWANALQGDTAGRGRIWSSAIEILFVSPWIGVGEGGYFTEIYEREYRYIDAHNLFIYVAVSGGLLGLGLLLWFVGRLAFRAYRPLKSGDALPFILLFNMIFIAAKTGGALTYLLLWFVFAMVSASGYDFKSSLNGAQSVER